MKRKGLPPPPASNPPLPGMPPKAAPPEPQVTRVEILIKDEDAGWEAHAGLTDDGHGDY